MRHSLRAHIVYLEGIIRSAKERLTAHHLSDEEIEDFRLQLTLAESALEHYRQAYELELSVSGPGAPDQPGSQSNGTAGDANHRSGKDRNGGRGGSRSARRKRARALAPVGAPAWAKKMRIG
ncbi:MAG: hypothetical protein ACLGSD_06375 [Acidobacteriota bacterium]